MHMRRLTPCSSLYGAGFRRFRATVQALTLYLLIYCCQRLQNQSRPSKVGIWSIWDFINLVTEIGKHILKNKFLFPFPFFFFLDEIFFQVSLLLNRLSVGQWVSRLFAFPKIVLLPECGTRDCGLLCETGRPTEAGTMLLFLFLSVAPMEVF